jgi:hypothetical protein
VIYSKFSLFKNISFFLLLLFFMNSCSTSKENSDKVQGNQPSFNDIAQEKFSTDYKTAFNTDSTYVIVYYFPRSKIKSQNPPLRFFVYNTFSKEIIFQDNLSNGKVGWKNNYQFTVSTIPEIVKGNDDENIQMFGYTYDVISRRKLSDIDKNE